jgi:WD40 repeat protein
VGLYSSVVPYVLDQLALRSLRRAADALRVSPRQSGVALGFAAVVVGSASSPASASKIVYVCGKDLCRADLRSGDRVRLTRDGARAGGYSRPSLSRNGKRLAYKRGDPGRVFTSDSRRRRVKRIPAAPDGPRDATQFDVELSPDGERVAWVELRINVIFGGVDYRRYLASFRGARPRQVASNGGRPFVGFTNGGSIIREGDPVGAGPPDRGLCVPDPATATNGVCRGAGSLLARDPARTLRGPAISPSGRLLAVTASTGSSSRVLETEPRGAIALYDTRTGVLVRNLTTGVRDSHPAFSSDGRYVAFSRGRSIWRVRTRGGAPRRLIRRGTQPAWGR